MAKIKNIEEAEKVEASVEDKTLVSTQIVDGKDGEKVRENVYSDGSKLITHL